MKRADLTRRALAQLRINMAALKTIITKCKNEGLISSKKFPTPGRGGVVPEEFFLTSDGKTWLREKEKELKKGKK